jgi:transposase-like protein
MARQKRQFSREFKSEAVRLSYQRQKIKDLADELGIQAAWIYKWRAGYSAFQPFNKFPCPTRASTRKLILRWCDSMTKQKGFGSVFPLR